MFTDKTGTLTENNMEFIECCVDGHVYVPHAICNGQIMAGATGMDMIDSSPTQDSRVGDANATPALEKPAASIIVYTA